MTRSPSMTWRARDDLASRPWTGRVRDYDLIKEVIIGFVVVAAVALGLAGMLLPIDTATDFVINPLKTLPAVPLAVTRWTNASASQRSRWADAYAKALAADKGPTLPNPAPGDYGPVPDLVTSLTRMARSGTLDGALASQNGFYQLNYTPAILFLGDGQYFRNLATSQHLTGDQLGMMNETGNTPGQSWLWLFSFFYQVEPFASAPHADLVIVLIMAGLTALLALLPFIPGLRTIPKWIPLHRVIWRDYYRAT